MRGQKLPDYFLNDKIMRKFLKVFLFVSTPLWMLPALIVIGVYSAYNDFSDLFDNITEKNDK